METTYGRNNRDNEFRASTTHDLGCATERLQLRIETSKSPRGVKADACVVHLTDDGFTHTFSFGGEDDDFRKTLIVEPAARATESNIRKVHARALEHFDAVLVAARAHYVVQDLVAMSKLEVRNDPMDDVNYVGHPTHY